jgi:hypothetical protein
MRYLEKSFQHSVGSESYREGWERIFGKKDDALMGKKLGEACELTPAFPLEGDKVEHLKACEG